MLARFLYLALFGLLTLNPSIADAASTLKEVNNAVQRGRDGGTTFQLHLANGETVIIDGDDYDDADLWFRVNTEVPSLILLYQGRGKEKHNIAINLDSASYYRVDVLKERDWVYTVHVYW